MTANWEARYRSLGLHDDVIEQLRAFLMVTEELSTRRYFRTRQNLELFVEADRARVEGVSDHGDAEDLRSALMTLRKLLSDQEPCFVNRVVSHLMRTETDVARKDRLQKGYQEIKRARKEPAEAIGMMGEDGSLALARGRTREAALRDLFNTQLFHQDQRAVPPLPETRGPDLPDTDLNMMLLRQNILELVFDEAEFAMWLRDFVTSAD